MFLVKDGSSSNRIRTANLTLCHSVHFKFWSSGNLTYDRINEVKASVDLILVWSSISSSCQMKPDEPPPWRQSFLMIGLRVCDQWYACGIKCKWVLMYRKWFEAHVPTISVKIVNHRKDFKAVAIQYNVRRWLNSGVLGTQGASSFSSPVGTRPLLFPVPRSSDYTQ